MTPSEKRAAEQVVEALRRVRNLAADATTQPLWHVLREIEAIERIAAAALAAWDAESGGERPGNGVEGLREPSASALTHGVSGRSPALPDPSPWFMRCPWCKGTFRAVMADPKYYDSCPLCIGSFLWRRPERVPDPALPADPAAVPPATSPASDVHAGGGEPASEELLEQPTGLLDDLARQMGVETPAERKRAK